MRPREQQPSDDSSAEEAATVSESDDERYERQGLTGRQNAALSRLG